MKIDRVTARSVQLPVREPMVTGNIRIESVCFLVLDLDTDQGLTGRSYVWSFNLAGAQALQATVQHLSTMALGENPFFTARLWEKMWRATVQWGHGGMPVMALAAIDAAAWDLVGRAAGQPLANLLGRRLERVPAYASGLWITDDFDRLAAEAAETKARGFRAMKMRVGRSDIAKDVDSVRAVRDAVGRDVHLMVDFSSVLTRDHATRLARALETFDLFWIEDPIVDENVEDHAALAREIRTPICFGEKVYAPQGLKRIIDAGAADVLMADMQRAGGVTGWNRIAAMADAARLPLSSHILPELNLHLVASAPTGQYLEYMTWAEDLFEQPMDLRDGMIGIPDRPGFGLVWDEDRLAKHCLHQQEYRT